MKRLIGALTAIAYLALVGLSGIAQTSSNVSADSSQDSAQESSRNSLDQSSENSSDSDSWAESSRSSSEQSSAASSEQTSNGDESQTVSLIVAGAITVVAIVGPIITAKAKKAKQDNVIGLQDQIYLAQGRDYEAVRDFFGLGDRDIVMANDELVTEGYLVVDDQSAADYLAALMLKCAERSDKIKAELAL